jgi:hypothetical protein
MFSFEDGRNIEAVPNAPEFFGDALNIGYKNRALIMLNMPSSQTFRSYIMK